MAVWVATVMPIDNWQPINSVFVQLVIMPWLQQHNNAQPVSIPAWHAPTILSVWHVTLVIIVKMCCHCVHVRMATMTMVWQLVQNAITNVWHVPTTHSALLAIVHVTPPTKSHVHALMAISMMVITIFVSSVCRLVWLVQTVVSVWCVIRYIIVTCLLTMTAFVITRHMNSHRCFQFVKTVITRAFIAMVLRVALVRSAIRQKIDSLTVVSVNAKSNIMMMVAIVYASHAIILVVAVSTILIVWRVIQPKADSSMEMCVSARQAHMMIMLNSSVSRVITLVRHVPMQQSVWHATPLLIERWMGHCVTALMATTIMECSSCVRSATTPANSVQTMILALSVIQHTSGHSTMCRVVHAIPAILTIW